MIGQIADALKDTKHPLVPHSVVSMGNGSNGSANGSAAGRQHAYPNADPALTDKLGLCEVKDGGEAERDGSGSEGVPQEDHGKHGRDREGDRGAEWRTPLQNREDRLGRA